MRLFEEIKEITRQPRAYDCLEATPNQVAQGLWTNLLIKKINFLSEVVSIQSYQTTKGVAKTNKLFKIHLVSFDLAQSSLCLTQERALNKISLRKGL